jgi:hypothetical protein
MTYSFTVYGPRRDEDGRLFVEAENHVAVVDAMRWPARPLPDYHDRNRRRDLKDTREAWEIVP